MKLKTIQEIWRKHIEDYPNSKYAYEFSESMKKVVIEWIKELSSDEYHHTKEEYPFCDPTDIILWIEYFFNIKEEEIK